MSTAGGKPTTSSEDVACASDWDAHDCDSRTAGATKSQAIRGCISAVYHGGDDAARRAFKRRNCVLDLTIPRHDGTTGGAASTSGKTRRFGGSAADSDCRRRREAFNDAAYQRRDQVLRLRFYDHVATRFAAEYAPQIERGYAALGLAAPNFAELSRPAAMSEIGKLRARLDNPPVPAAAVRLEELVVGGVVNLDERVLPTRWL